MPSINSYNGTLKSRGAFFTPPQIASFLVSWAIQKRTDVVFEPSCGEAAFLTAALTRLQELGAPDNSVQLYGIDIHPQAVKIAEALVNNGVERARLEVADFFHYNTRVRFDAVVGNPPFVRYQDFSGAVRAKAQAVALSNGVRLPGLASSWAAFTVHAASFIKPDGRLALVLPAELLHVNYAGPIRRFLMNRFRNIQLVLFEERVFPGVLEEIVLLLAEGEGPTDHCEIVQARNLSDLSKLTCQKWTPSSEQEKWITGLLPADARNIYQDFIGNGCFETLDQWGQTSLGMVTGNNKFFTFNTEAARRMRLSNKDLLPICPPGSRHLRGLGFTELAWEEMKGEGRHVYLFNPNVDRPSDAALAYIKQGEVDGVHEAYKCRVRSPWWIVPKVATPDAFFTYMNHDTPRIVANRGAFPYLNSVHGVTFEKSRRHIGMDLLPIAALNSMTLLGSELVGRSYGGGMLKLEPKEAGKLPVPALHILERAEHELRTLRPQLAKALRQGKLLAAVKEVDRIFIRSMRLSSTHLSQIRKARHALFQRRVSRAQTDL